MKSGPLKVRLYLTNFSPKFSQFTCKITPITSGFWKVCGKRTKTLWSVQFASFTRVKTKNKTQSIFQECSTSLKLLKKVSFLWRTGTIMILQFHWQFWLEKESFCILSHGLQTESRTLEIHFWSQSSGTLKIICSVRLENWSKQNKTFPINLCWKRPN